MCTKNDLSGVTPVLLPTLKKKKKKKGQAPPRADVMLPSQKLDSQADTP